MMNNNVNNNNNINNNNIIKDIINNKFYNRYVKLLSLILLLIFIIYILIVTDNLITVFNFFKIYRKYMHILLGFGSFLLLLHFFINLYTLHKCVLLNNKSEKLKISPVLPDFYIKYLEQMYLFSSDKDVVKYLKRIYFVQAIIYAIVSLTNFSIFILMIA